MTPERIRAELEGDQPPSPATLRRAVDQAAALSPQVVAVLERLGDGIVLYSHEASFAFFDVHAMAAARRHEVLRPLLRALSSPDPELEFVFGDVCTTSLPGIAVSLFDGDPEPLIAVIENPKADSFVRWNLFNALARLAYDGAFPRERMLALIDRFERDRLASRGDAVWQGWIEAIVWLDLADHAERARAAVRDGRGPEREADIADLEEMIEGIVSQAGPPEEFETQRIRPIDDVVEALDWWLLPTEPEDADGAETQAIGQSAPEDADDGDHQPTNDGENQDALDAPGGEPPDENDPDEIALMEEEIGWLRVFFARAKSRLAR
jgi:uncharacterized protein